jgi:hypothetical protein
MSTSSKNGGCKQCLININWTHVEVYKEREVSKAPPNAMPPNPPSSCNVYPPGGGPYMVSDPNWDKDQVLADYNHEFVEDYYIGADRSCIGQASNVREVDQKTVNREEFLGNTNPSVDFYWQCSGPNPNPPPPEILTTAGPESKSFDRETVIEYTDVYTFYEGQIICTCGQPVGCGCY